MRMDRSSAAAEASDRPSGAQETTRATSALSARACKNLAGMPSVTLLPHSGAEGRLPASDALYVSAGATAPLDIWLDALRPAGRLLFPLTPDGHGSASGAGGMLLVTRVQDRYAARFICPVMIIECAGGRNHEMAKKLEAAGAKVEIK